MRSGVSLACSATQIVQDFLAAWIAGDVNGALAWFAPEGVYALHISDELLPSGGESVGRDNFASALRSFRENFDYLLFRPLAMTAEEPIVRLQVEFMYRHRLSGEMLNGRLRLVFRVENGLITRIDEYHDRAKVEAFMRLFGRGA